MSNRDTTNVSSLTEPIDAALEPLVTRVRRRMTWRHATPWLLRGLAACAAAAGGIVIAARVASWPGASPWALAAGLVLLLAGAAMGWLRRPSTAAALRGADRLLGLQDRLTTAWEYRDGAAPIVRLQRADLAARARTIDLSSSLPLRPHPREAVAPLGGTALLLVALVWPAGSAAARATHEATRAHVAYAAARIETARRTTATLPHGALTALPKADRLRQAQITRVLARLRRELAAAKTPSQALTALARAQAALNSLRPANAAAQRAALSALASALQRTAAGKNIASALRQLNPKAVATAMRKLAQGLAHASPAQQAALARAMQSAAQAASADPSLAQALQNAATSLAQGNTSGAQSSLQKATSQAASDAARTLQQQALDQANAALDQARNDVAGLGQESQAGTTPGKGGNSAQAGAKAGTGQGAGAGKGSRGGNSRGQGQGGKGQSGTHGAGQGNGQGTGKGKGRGNGQGAGGQGTGQGKGRGAGGQGQGKGRGAGGSGTGTGQGAGAGQGTGSGSGQGSGQGNGSGQGTGSGSGGNGQGQGGGPGGGGARGGNGGSGGKTLGDRIYIPGPTGQGPSTSGTGTSGTPSRGSLQPWRSVLPSYERGALNGPGSSAIPANQRPLVKSYFDQLNHY